MEVLESITKPSNDQHDSTCPFCAGGEPELRGLTTCKGSENRSPTLKTNLGNQPDYILERDIVEDFPVNVVPAAHHLIPGNQAMDEHKIEKYTTTKENKKLLEDIGYNIIRFQETEIYNDLNNVIRTLEIYLENFNNQSS